MWKLIGRRLLLTIPLLLIVSVMVFGLAQLIPGDPAITLAGETATPERIEEIRQKLGQNKPLINQYVDMMTGIAQGDLGTSLYSTQKVTSALSTAIPATLSLSIVALLFLVLVGVPFGILAGTRPGSLLDRTLSGIAALGVAAPAYWVGMILLIVFALRLGWFPTTQYVPMSAGVGKWLHHLLLPAFALSLAGIVEVTRQLRSAMQEVMHQDFIRTARAKGLPARVVIYKHALKTAISPAITVIGLQINSLLGGAIAVELVFNLNGIGLLAVRAVQNQDIPVIQGIVLVSVVVVTFSNLLVDIVYGRLNPKVRSQ
jgi:peptide/nickel transport system permease protein